MNEATRARVPVSWRKNSTLYSLLRDKWIVGSASSKFRIPDIFAKGEVSLEEVRVRRLTTKLRTWLRGWKLCVRNFVVVVGNRNTTPYSSPRHIHRFYDRQPVHCSRHLHSFTPLSFACHQMCILAEPIWLRSDENIVGWILRPRDIFP